MVLSFESLDEILKCEQSIQVKAIEQYVPEVYCLLCCTKWFYLLSLWVKLQSMTIQMTATKQYFPMVLFITFVHSGWVLTLLEFL